MKILLFIFAALMILLAGGCAVVAGRDLGLISLVLWGIVVLNVLLIVAMAGKSGPMAPVFIILMVLDAGVVVGVPVLALSQGTTDPAIWWPVLLICAAFAAKGGLTYGVYRRMKAEA
jgi:hypothetical protein